MDLLAQDFGSITCQDVVEFCNQQIVENTELDYKMVIPRDLTKHFSAMSNRYGGLIIVGVGEDSQTGLPTTYEGIVNDGKQIDRVHQFANNVRPLPPIFVGDRGRITSAAQRSFAKLFPGALPVTHI